MSGLTSARIGPSHSVGLSRWSTSLPRLKQRERRRRVPGAALLHLRPVGKKKGTISVGVDDGLAGRLVGAVSLERQNPGGAYSLGPSMPCPQPASDFRRQVRPSVWRSDLAARARNAANPQIRHNAASNRCDLSSAQARRKLDMLAQHARPTLRVHSMESRKLE